MNPTQYDRELVKRLRSMKEGGNAIFNTQALDYAYYGDEARKNLMLQSIADQNEYRDAMLQERRRMADERKNQFNTSVAFTQKSRRDQDKMDNTAENFGWADIFLGGVQGVNSYNKEKNKASQNDEMAEILRQLIRS